MPLSKEAIEARKSAIGSSDIAKLVLGQDAIDLYARLTGDAPPGEFSNNAIERGNRLESTVLDWIADNFHTPVRPGTLERHQNYTFEIANLDAWVHGNLGALPLEAKTAAGAKADEWGEADSDLVPLNYQLQVQWQLWVTEKPMAWLGVLLGGQQFEYRRYIIKADPELQDMLHTAAYKFITQHVQPKIAPTPSGSENYLKWLQRRYPKSTDLWLGSTAEIDRLVVEYNEACAEGEVVEGRAATLKQQIIGIIGDACGINGTDYRITYKAPKDSRRWDLERLETDHPELAEKYTKYTPNSRRFLLKFNKRGNGHE